MLGKVDTHPTCKAEKLLSLDNEWIPGSLRDTRAFSLAPSCVLFTARLRALDSAVRNHHSDHATGSAIINIVTCLTTVGTILIGFVVFCE